MLQTFSISTLCVRSFESANWIHVFYFCRFFHQVFYIAVGKFEWIPSQICGRLLCCVSLSVWIQAVRRTGIACKNHDIWIQPFSIIFTAVICAFHFIQIRSKISQPQSEIDFYQLLLQIQEILLQLLRRHTANEFSARNLCTHSASESESCKHQTYLSAIIRAFSAICLDQVT
jgi:hypothetical protein